MARRRRHLRGLASYVTLPFGVFKTPVNTGAVAIGAGLTLVGASVLKALMAKSVTEAGWAANIPGTVQNNVPVLFGAATAGVLYFATKKSGKRGYATGALGAGILMSAWENLKRAAPERFGDVVALRYNEFGMLVDSRSRGMGGILVDSPQRHRLAAVARAESTGEGEEEERMFG